MLLKISGELPNLVVFMITTINVSSTDARDGIIRYEYRTKIVSSQNNWQLD
jgi:hypothetical protein